MSDRANPRPALLRWIAYGAVLALAVIAVWMTEDPEGQAAAARARTEMAPYRAAGSAAPEAARVPALQLERLGARGETRAGPFNARSWEGLEAEEARRNVAVASASAGAAGTPAAVRVSGPVGRGKSGHGVPHQRRPQLGRPDGRHHRRRISRRSHHRADLDAYVPAAQRAAGTSDRQCAAIPPVDRRAVDFRGVAGCGLAPRRPPTDWSSDASAHSASTGNGGQHVGRDHRTTARRKGARRARRARVRPEGARCGQPPCERLRPYRAPASGRHQATRAGAVPRDRTVTDKHPDQDGKRERDGCARCGRCDCDPRRTRGRDRASSRGELN